MMVDEALLSKAITRIVIAPVDKYVNILHP